MKLDYQSTGPSPAADVRSPHYVVWAVLGAILGVVVHGIVATFLQDELINGDGRSWQRAHQIACVPSSLLIVFSINAMLQARRAGKGIVRLIVGWTIVGLAVALIAIGVLDI